jgi:tetratricopeptide (TPR) repeat protein
MLASEEVTSAEQLVRQALERTRRLTVEWPKVVTYRADLAGHHDFLGRILVVGRRFEEAEKVLRQAVAMYEKLAADLPSLPVYREAAGQCHHKLGNLLTRTGRKAEAEAAYRRGLNLFEKLVADFPDEPYCHDLLARGLMTVERYEEAEAVVNQALALYEKLVADFPETRDYWDELANCHSLLNQAMDSMGRKPPLKECQRVVAMFEKRVAEKPAVARYRSVLAEHYGYLGDYEKEAGQRQHAEQLYRKAIDLQEKLVAECPSVPQYRLNLARRLERLRNHYDDLRRFPEALAAIRRAVAIQEDAPAGGPWEPIANWWLTKGHALRQLGFLQIRLNESEGAQSSFRNAAAVFQRVSADSLDWMTSRHFQADSTRVLADLLARAGQDEEAEHAYRRAAHEFDELLRDFPEDRPVAASELLRGYTQFILFLKKRNRSEEAQAVLQRAERAYQRIMEQSSKDAMELVERAKAHALMKEAAGKVFPSKSE